jgi:murein DD-endopeptidase MepM/ murein hydrolase activator NlpD
LEATALSRACLAAALFAACATPRAGGPGAALTPPEPAAAQPAGLAHLFELPFAADLVVRMMGIEAAVEGSLRAAEDRLAALRPGARKVPDLTMLTTEPVARTESSGFGWRDDPIRHTRSFHAGTDFRGKPGAPVLAAGDGVVVFCGRLGGYGNAIDVDHGGGVVTRYAHLRRIETRKDAVVAAGAQIGQVGSTGRTTGPHLHFEVRIDGAPVSPIAAMAVAQLERDSPWLGQVAAATLAPEVQAIAESAVDPPKQRARTTEPAGRPGHGKRKQVLW